MTASTGVAPVPAEKSWASGYYALHPGYRLLVRWGLIVALTVAAFHDSLASVVETTRGGGVGGYVWTVPVAAILVALGVARRHRTELPIHDRQTDVIVGTMGLVLAFLIHAVLLGRYAMYFHVLRLDLVAMWMYVLSASIVLFGLRPVARFAWVWGMALLVFPLPYYLTVAFLGGGKVAAGAATLVISGLGTGIALGPTFRGGLIASAASWVIGATVLGAMVVFFSDAPLLAYQQNPALTTIIVVGGGYFLLARRGRPKRLLDRKVEPLAASQVWAGVPIVVIVGVALAFVHLPPTAGPARISSESGVALHQGQLLMAPVGWQVTFDRTYDWVHRLHGTGGNLTRQHMTADIGNPQWDKLGRPRTVVVDSIISLRPFSFSVYPARVLYDVAGARISEPRRVDLGSGVTGQMVSVVDDHLLVSWNALQLAWGDQHIGQQVVIFAVDDHDPNAPFPEPSGGLLPTLGTFFTILLRGNAADTDRAPAFKDADMLTQFGRALVAAQVNPARTSDER